MRGNIHMGTDPRVFGGLQRSGTASKGLGASSKDLGPAKVQGSTKLQAAAFRRKGEVLKEVGDAGSQGGQ